MQNNVLIKIDGKSPYRIMEKFHELNVSILNISFDQSAVFVKISQDDYQKVQKHLKSYHIEIVDYYGFLKIRHVIKKYLIILISFLIGLFVIFLSTNIIVDIDVIHENEELKSIILNDLYKMGVKEFSFKKSYQQLNKIKKQIKNNHLDRIEWIEISKVGMKYIIRVEERIINYPQEEKEYCNVVAVKPGIIKRINVYDGERLVEINDYVKKDDLLIRGDVRLNENVVSYNCANGDIYAEVWYVINVKVPLEHYEKQLTGKKRNNLIINYDGVDYKVFNDRLKDYNAEQKKIFDLLGIKIYLETDYEIKKKLQKHTEKEAIEKGISLAREKIMLKLKKDDQIISEKILQKTLIDSTMNIDIFIIAEENIAKVVEMKEDEINDL